MVSHFMCCWQSSFCQDYCFIIFIVSHCSNMTSAGTFLFNFQSASITLLCNANICLSKCFCGFLCAAAPRMRSGCLLFLCHTPLFPGYTDGVSLLFKHHCAYLTAVCHCSSANMWHMKIWRWSTSLLFHCCHNDTITSLLFHWQTSLPILNT